MVASGQPGHAGAPGQSLAEGAPGRGGDGSTLGECVPVLQMERKVPCGDPRAEGLPGGGSRLRPAPEAGRAQPLCLAPLQRPLKGPIVCRPQMCGFGRRHRGPFLLFSMTDLCHSRREGPAAPPGPRQTPGSREPAGRRPEKGALCAGHGPPFPVPLEMSKGSRTRQPEGSAAGGVKLGQESGDLKAAGNNSPGKNRVWLCRAERHLLSRKFPLCPKDSADNFAGC